jgi:hypothetical protein
MSFSVEDQLLFQCSRVKLDDEAIAAASDLLQKSPDWDYILEASIRHGVSPLFHYGLGQLAPVAELDRLVPAAVSERLQKLYLGNQARNRRLYATIGDIFNGFERAGVQAMGLKDIQLGREVYPDIGLRPMGDVDILIHAKDYEKAAACMAGLGFSPLPDADIPYTLKYALGHHFRRPSDNVWVDLQWDTIQREWDIYHEGNFVFEIDGMWRGARRMALDNCQLWVPKPEDMLFHLCLHLEGHRYAELILFCDIVEMLRHYEHQLDWQYIVDITRKYAAESSVYYVLSLVQRLFKVSLPPFLLRELEPAYFKAGVFAPLFGNLTSLHLSLDEIRRAACPPDEVMSEFEAVVRQQAASASRLYREIDAIASAFKRAGGSIVILDGAFPYKIFPDPRLKPFEEICCFILDRDLPCMRQTLSSCGYTARGAHDSDAYDKEQAISSADPLLARRPTRLVVHVDVETSFDYQSRQDSHASAKDVALRSVRAKLAGPKIDGDSLPAHFKIIALSPEDLVLHLAAQVGGQKENRLFLLNGLLEFFRAYSAPLDWQRVVDKAQHDGIGQSVAEGLSAAGGLLDDDLPATALPRSAELASPPRVLEWARYGPQSFDLHTGFRRPFFYVFSLLSVAGMKGKARYLFRSLVGYQGSKPVLPGLALELMTGALASLRSRRPAVRTLAYWVETDAAPETVPGNDELR